jgi:hypothetical protein
MGDSELQILITAVDEASETIDGVSASVTGMADEVAASTDAAAGSFAEFGLQVNATTGEIENALLTQEQSFAVAADLVNASNEEMIDLMVEEGITAQEAAATIAEANAEIASSSVAAKGGSAGAYAGLAAIAGIAFLAIKGAIDDAISSAQQWDETSAQVAQILKDTGSAIPLDQIQAYAQQVQSTTLFTQQEALASEALILSHTNLQGSYEETTQMAADLATKMGSDLPNATRILTNALTDPVAGLNQLIRQGNIDFPAATVTIIENMAKVGDTAGADALILQTLQNSIGGVAQAAAGAPGAALTQLGNQITALGTAIGNDLLPLLDKLAQDIEPIISDVIAWTTAHPKLTDAIVLGAAAVAGLALVVGLLAVAWITITPVVALVTTVFGALALAASLPLLPFIALGAAVVVLGALIISNWSALVADVEAIWEMMDDAFSLAWNFIINYNTNGLNLIKSAVHSVMSEISSDWNAIWTDISNFFSNIWNAIVSGLKTEINDVISILDSLISAIDALHINIPAITIPGTKIGTQAVDIGFDIPQIPHLATGGIVSVPTVALIGEAGPEAVMPLSAMGGAAGGMQQIVININGGVFPADASTIRQIGNLLANSIVQNIRVKNYAL